MTATPTAFRYGSGVGAAIDALVLRARDRAAPRGTLEADGVIRVATPGGVG